MGYKSNLKAIQRKLDAGTRKGVASAAVILQNEIKQQLSKRGGTRATGNTPSPPGQPPAAQTGTLRRSIQIDKTGLNEPNPSVLVGTNLSYARIHEFGGVINHPGGTPYIIVGQGKAAFISERRALQLDGKGVKYTKPHTIRMPKRPYFRPGIEVAKPKMLTAFREEMEEALRGQ